MWSQRSLLGWVLGLGLAGLAAAQTPSSGTLRWSGAGNGFYGLQANRADFRLNLQAGEMEPTPMDRVLGRTRQQGLNVAVTGNKGWSSDLGVYGRLGTVSGRSGNPLAAARLGAIEGSLTYGVGLSWDFSPRASAVLGWDSYDFRTAGGERDVRATSLGLQLRY